MRHLAVLLTLVVVTPLSPAAAAGGSITRWIPASIERGTLALSPTNERFEVHEGTVFRQGGDGTLTPVPGVSGVRQILFYKDQLIALDADGNVRAFVTVKGAESARWHRIQGNAVRIAADCEDLFALTEKTRWFSSEPRRGVWRYQGQPGQETWHLMPMTTMIAAGNGILVPLITLIPMSSGVPIAFEKLDVLDPVELVKDEDKVAVRTRDGRTIPLSRTGTGTAP